MGGATRLQLFTGAKNFARSNTGPTKDMPSLSFEWEAAAKNKADKIIIYLNEGSDTYDIQYWRTPNDINELDEYLKDHETYLMGEHVDVYSDMLIPLFEEDTGLLLSF